MGQNPAARTYLNQVTLLVLQILLLGSFSANARADGVDLHCHLFMHRALAPFFRGQFNEPLQASSWKDKLKSKANRESLEASNTSIVVAALYALPGLAPMRASIRKQIAVAREFLKSNPDWVQAINPAQAESALKHGKHVLILALEGAYGVLETDDDVREFIDEDGIRIVTPIHLMDDHFGGSGFHKGILALTSPFAFVGSLFNPIYKDGVRVNPQGLTFEGTKLILSLMNHKVWIDLSHASDATQQTIMGFYEEKKLPLLFTHTVLRRYFAAERAISDFQIQQVKKSRGLIGLMPSSHMLEGTPHSDICAQKDNHQGLSNFLTQYNDATEILGADHVMLGTDFNAPLDHLPPPPCDTGSSLDAKGFWNLGQESDLWNFLSIHSKAGPRAGRGTAETFINTWKEIYR